MEFTCIIFLIQSLAAGYQTKTLLGRKAFRTRIPLQRETIKLGENYYLVGCVVHTPEETYCAELFVKECADPGKTT